MRTNVTRQFRSRERSVPVPRRRRRKSPSARAFQFGQKFRFDSIGQSDKFAACTLILNSNDGEFGEGPPGVFLRCGSFCAISVSIRQ